jgi:hypothetical protein
MPLRALDSVMVAQIGDLPMLWLTGYKRKGLPYGLIRVHEFLRKSGEQWICSETHIPKWEIGFFRRLEQRSLAASIAM